MMSTIHAKSWYFVSRPYSHSLVPIEARSAAESIITHYAAADEDEGLYHLAGFVRFRAAISLSAVQTLFGPFFQLLPRSVAHLYSRYLKVDFKQWNDEDFDFDKYDMKSYPWEQVSLLLLRLITPIAPSRSIVIVDDWPDD